MNEHKQQEILVAYVFFMGDGGLLVFWVAVYDLKE